MGKRPGRLMVLIAIIMMAALLMQVTAYAAAKYKAKTSCKVFSKASSKANARKVSKGKTVLVYAAKGKWCKVKVGGVNGYMLKSSLTKPSSKSGGYKKLRKGSTGSKVKKLQKQLARRGFISSKSVSGKYTSSTAKAVRQYQMMAGLSVSGVATVSTLKKLFSTNSHRPKVSKMKWSNYTMSSLFPVGGQATIVDLNTGLRMRIRRVGGTNHLDVEPSYSSDTAVLKKMYHGKFSWDSRAVLLIAGGRYIAGAINGMPHGDEISTSNNYKGQFCLHLYGSKTHGSNKVNAAHQKNIRRVYNYFK